MYLDISKNESIWLEQMLDRANMVTSYKIYWFIGIYEEITLNSSKVISFDTIVSRMITNSWYTLIKYKLNFGFQDQLGKIVHYLNFKYNFGAEINKDKLYIQLTESEIIKKDKEFQTLKRNFYNMVPYRLLSPFFRKQTMSLKDQAKNRLIAELSKNDSKCFYAVDEQNKSIIINDNWIEYIKENQAVIDGWIKHKLILYLQAKNPSVPNIPLKIEPPYTRNLSKATNYWKTVIELNKIKDIYTGLTFTEENHRANGALSIDHFIPWSFVLHDEVWNLIPTFKNINSSKNDKLPKIERYINTYCELHFTAINTFKKTTSNPKIFEEYISILNNKNIENLMHKSRELEKEKFIESLKSAVSPIYHIALNQGFEIWDN